MLENLIIKMEKFTKIKSVPAYIPLMNIDTDKIIPKQFLKTIKRSGLGKSLFYEMRFDEKGNPIEGFILDQEPFNSSKILITGKNFGCGSSREHAPWALLDFGITCVISSSFADIFYSNCFKNGILPIILNNEKIKELSEYANRKEEILIDLKRILDNFCKNILGPKILSAPHKGKSSKFLTPTVSKNLLYNHAKINFWMSRRIMIVIRQYKGDC